MAENKKSVLLYCDIIHTVEELDDADAGLLFKHYLRYINDQNPDPPSKLIKIVFEPIKQNLKRDLKKWEQKSAKNSESAKKRWSERTEENANASERTERNAKDADKVTVKDTVTVNDTDNVKEKVIKKKRIVDLIFPFDSENFKEQWENWKQYKKDQHKFTYKGNLSEQAALKKLGELSQNSETIAIKIIHESISNGWAGFFKLKDNGQSTTTETLAEKRLRVSLEDFSKRNGTNTSQSS